MNNTCSIASASWPVQKQCENQRFNTLQDRKFPCGNAHHVRGSLGRVERKVAIQTKALLLGLVALASTSHASAPTPVLLYTAPNNAAIHGGVATICTSGVTYFSTLSTASTRANVTALN